MAECDFVSIYRNKIIDMTYKALYKKIPMEIMMNNKTYTTGNKTLWRWRWRTVLTRHAGTFIEP
jgi:hypothetical protein